MVDVGWYRTTIRSFEREIFNIPNSVFSRNVVLNITRKQKEWRFYEFIGAHSCPSQCCIVHAYCTCLIIGLDDALLSVLHLTVPKTVNRSLHTSRSFSRQRLEGAGSGIAGLRVDDVGKASAVIADMRKIIRQDPRIIQKLHRRVFFDKLTREQARTPAELLLAVEKILGLYLGDCLGTMAVFHMLHIVQVRRLS